jgi:NADPH:quinone reductase-like Zn-dependent oxidoreductase
MPTMKAVVTTGDGGVQLQDVDIPVPQPNQILVKVVAAAQNPADCMGTAIYS